MSSTKNAAFNLIGYEFPDVYMKGCNRPLTDTLSINISVNGLYDNKNSIFELFFSTLVSEKGKDPYISVVCNAQYKFSEVISFESIPEYFFANSIAILFPYVRAYISLLTTHANRKAIILPTLNLTSLAFELQKNTALKDADN